MAASISSSGASTGSTGPFQVATYHVQDAASSSGSPIADVNPVRSRVVRLDDQPDHGVPAGECRSAPVRRTPAKACDREDRPSREWPAARPNSRRCSSNGAAAGELAAWGE